MAKLKNVSEQQRIASALEQIADNGGGGGGSTTLAGLTDVDLSNPTDGQTLVYNATAGKWENGASGGGVVNIPVRRYSVEVSEFDYDIFVPYNFTENRVMTADELASLVYGNNSASGTVWNLVVPDSEDEGLTSNKLCEFNGHFNDSSTFGIDYDYVYMLPMAGGMKITRINITLEHNYDEDYDDVYGGITFTDAASRSFHYDPNNDSFVLSD